MSNIFEGMTNLYSLSKTLRFELKLQTSHKELQKVKDGEIENDTNFMIQLCKDIYEFLHIYTNSWKQIWYRKDAIRRFFPDYYNKKPFDDGKKWYIIANDNPINDVWLKVYWDQWIMKWIYNILSELYMKNEHWNEEGALVDSVFKKRSYILECFQSLANRELLWFFIRIVNDVYLDHKWWTSEILKLQKYIERIESGLQSVMHWLRCAQSVGLKLENFTFNFFTHQKSSRLYKDDIKKLEDRRVSLSSKLNELAWLGQNTEKSKIANDMKDEILKFNTNKNKWVYYKIDDSKSLQEIKDDMKQFKAEQKILFMKYLDQDKEWKKCPEEYINNNPKHLELYTCKYTNRNVLYNLKDSDYTKIWEDTWKIKLYAEDFDKNKSSLELIKTQRWWQISKASYFKNFCKVLKYISSLAWKENAEVRAMKKEKIISQQLYHRACLSKKWQDVLLHTFDIDDIDRWQNVYRKILNYSANEEWESIYVLTSLTFRALYKLCHKKWGSFLNKSLLDVLDDSFMHFKNWKKIRILKNIDDLGVEDQIAFYKDVLLKQSTIILQPNLGQEQKENLIEEMFDWVQTIKDLDIAIKKYCYTWKKYYIPVWLRAEIKKQGNTYVLVNEKIKRPQNKWYYNDWLEFYHNIDNPWSRFLTRLNPEWGIRYISKEDAYKKVCENQGKNRREQDRFLWYMTISTNINAWEENTSYMEEKKQYEYREDFNTKFEKDNNLPYYYWIDVWTNELVTLWVYKMDNVNLVNAKFEDINVYRITPDWMRLTEKTYRKYDNSQHEHVLYKNPSLFIKNKRVDINDERYFEKLSGKDDFLLSRLDVAKVIDNSIFVNWDINTYINYLIANAKHMIWKKMKTGVEFDKMEWNHCEDIGLHKFNLYLKWKNQWKILELKADEIYKDNLLEEIKIQLDTYAKDIEQADYIPMSKINNYRKALCANMVWIISLVNADDKYPWYLVFEGKNIEDTYEKLNEIDTTNTYLKNILFDAIIQKFSRLWQMPPISKSLKEKLKKLNRSEVQQYWRFLFMPQHDTSNQCPMHNCVNKLYWHQTKFEHEMHHYVEWNCIDYGDKLEDAKKTQSTGCPYHMSKNACGFDFIKSWDDLATYNIAKKWREYLRSKGIV